MHLIHTLFFKSVCLFSCIIMVSENWTHDLRVALHVYSSLATVAHLMLLIRYLTYVTNSLKTDRHLYKHSEISHHDMSAVRCKPSSMHPYNPAANAGKTSLTCCLALIFSMSSMKSVNPNTGRNSLISPNRRVSSSEHIPQVCFLSVLNGR